jgi:Ca2+-binding EF-hand superfamily protein
MGCGVSSPIDGPVYTHMIKTFDAVIRSLKVSKDEVDVIYLKWAQADENGDAFMSLDEFHDMLGMKRSKLTERIFAILDRNNSGEVDFGEWFCMIWQYLSFSRMSLMSLAFQLMDRDGNGLIDSDEAREFIEDMRDSGFGKDKLVNYTQLVFDIAAAKNAQDAVMPSKSKRDEKKKAKEIDEPVWMRYALKNPALLYPALQIQDMLRDRIGGRAFWEAATEKRAGKLEMMNVRSFCEQIKLEVHQHRLLTSISSMVDGFAVASDLAPTGDVERIRDIWATTYGAGKRALMMNREDSLKALNENKNRGKRTLKGLVRGLSSKLIAATAMKSAGDRAREKMDNKRAEHATSSKRKVAPSS